MAREIPPLTEQYIHEMETDKESRPSLKKELARILSKWTDNAS